MSNEQLLAAIDAKMANVYNAAPRGAWAIIDRGRSARRIYSGAFSVFFSVNVVIDEGATRRGEFIVHHGATLSVDA